MNLLKAFGQRKLQPFLMKLARAKPLVSIYFSCFKRAKSEAVPVYKNVSDRETGELKPVLDYYLCKSCDDLVKKRPKT